MFLICVWMPFFHEWSEFKVYFSYPMMWVLVYFCIAYLKSYHMNLLNSRKFSIALFLVGFIGLISQIAATYYFGSRTFLFHGTGMRWNMWDNLFEWFFAFGAFNLFRTFHFHSLFINRLSSLSLLIYLIHENFLVRDWLYDEDHCHAIEPTRIHTELGWLPETKFADGIQKTIEWYLNNKPWWETIISGEYVHYYEKMYGNR